MFTAQLKRAAEGDDNGVVSTGAVSEFYSSAAAANKKLQVPGAERSSVSLVAAMQDSFTISHSSHKKVGNLFCTDIMRYFSSTAVLRKL